MAHIIDPDFVNAVGQKAIGLPKEDMFDQIADDLAREYGDHVDTGPRRWMLSNAGGVMGEVALVHASLSEYILFFVAPVATAGHSGRYRAQLWDFYLAGRVHSYEEGELDTVTYEPGDFSSLRKGRATGVEIEAGTILLEYARGPIPTMVPFGLSDSVFSTLDLRTIFATSRRYGWLALRELLRGKI